MNIKRYMRLIGGLFIIAALSISVYALTKEDSIMSTATAVTNNDFDNEVLKSDIPVLVDFYADWCGPCRALGPTVDEIAKEYAGKVKVFKVNVDNEPALAQKYGIQSIPCLIIFKDGKVAIKLVGFRPKKDITAELDKVL